MKNKFLVLTGTVLVLMLGSCVISYDEDSDTKMVPVVNETPDDEGGTYTGNKGATYSVSGTVSVSDQSAAIRPAGTRVELRRDDKIVQFAETAVGENGAYTLNGVEPGSYTLEMAKVGYLTGVISTFEVKDANVTGKNITLKKSTVPITSYTISGTITGSLGTKAAGAYVQLRRDGHAVGSVEEADADGAYTINGVAAGTYLIEVSLDGYGTEETDLFDVSSNLLNKDITLKKPISPASLTYTISGKVSLSDKGNAEGAHIQLRQDGHAVENKSTVAGTTGAYTINGVAAGTYTIEASLDGYDTRETDSFDVAGNVSGKTVVLTKTVDAANTYTISGTITGSLGTQAAGAYVQLRRDGHAVGSVEETDADGAYTINGVAAGTYLIEVSLNGYGTEETDSFTVSSNLTKNITLQNPISLAYYTVSGKVSLSDNGDAAGARIELRKDGHAVQSESSFADADGAYSISGIAAGTYTIEVSLNGYDTKETDSFEVSGNLLNKNITLNKAVVYYTISGTISTNNGSSAAGAEVQLRKNGQPVGEAGKAGTDGMYTLSGVEAGTYSIEVKLYGYGTGTMSNVMVSSTNVTGKDIRLNKLVVAAYTVSGAISGTGNQQVVGAKVSLVKNSETTPSASFTTGLDGTFSMNISSIATDEWVIKVSHDSYNDWTSGLFYVTGNIEKNPSITAKGFPVSGIIRTDIGGVAAGATVTLKAKNGSVYATTTTNINGYYLIGNVAASSGYSIEATLDGYKRAVSYSFSAGSSASTQNLTITALVFSVSGKIRTDDGKGAWKANVQLKQHGVVIQTEQSAYDTGFYEFEDVPVGTYTISVSSSGYKEGTIEAFTVSGDVEDKNLTLVKQ